MGANRQKMSEGPARSATEVSARSAALDFRAAVEALPAAVYITDAEGRITFYNDAAAALWGHRPPLGDGRWCGSWRLYWPDGTPMAHDQCPMAQAIKQNRPITGLDAIAERPDGSRVHFMPYPMPLHDATGALVGAVNILVDVTERRWAEARVRQSETRYRGIFEGARVALWEQDFSPVVALLDHLRRQGVGDLRSHFRAHPDELAAAIASVRIVDVNSYALEIFEADDKQELLSSLARIFVPATESIFVEELVTLFEGRRHFEGETVLRTLKGRQLDAMLTIAFGGEQCEQTLVSLVDVSAIKAGQRAIEEERRLASIIESSDDAIISKDLDGIITSWNRGAERLYGYTAAEAIGQSVMILIPPDRADEEPGIIQRIRRGERIDHYETVRRRKDGSLVDISLTVSPIKGENGRIIGASKIARDITERRRDQRQQQLLVGEIKHRIKNTLATVQAIARQTLTRTPVEERDAFIARLSALANAHDLLTVERWNRAALRDVVDRALQPFQERHGPARLLISGPEEVWLSAQRASLLAMALHELATNAVKYGALSNDNGVVLLQWEKVTHDDEARVKIGWSEVGGPPVAAPDRKGFGSFLIERAIEGVGGSAQMEFRPEGMACTLELAV